MLHKNRACGPCFLLNLRYILNSENYLSLGSSGAELAIHNGVGWEEDTKELNFERECRGELLSPALLTASDESLSSVIFSVWIAACILSAKPTWVCFFLVLGFGMDPDLQMDIITELDLVNTTLGVTQVAGLHNASKAFLFHGKKHTLLCMGQG